MKRPLEKVLSLALILVCGWMAYQEFVVKEARPEVAESYCIDGIVVIADGEVIGCVNGEQSAGNINWTPDEDRL